MTTNERDAAPRDERDAVREARAIIALVDSGQTVRESYEEFAPLLRALADECDALRATVARLERAARTRDDYDLRCQNCGAPHNLDTSIPSEIWNQIAEPEDILCTLCIEEKLQAKGLTAKAQFYFSGEALSSQLYQDDLEGIFEDKRDEIAAPDAPRDDETRGAE